MPHSWVRRHTGRSASLWRWAGATPLASARRPYRAAAGVSCGDGAPLSARAGGQHTAKSTDGGRPGSGRGGAEAGQGSYTRSCDAHARLFSRVGRPGAAAAAAVAGWRRARAAVAQAARAVITAVHGAGGSQRAGEGGVGETGRRRVRTRSWHNIVFKNMHAWRIFGAGPGCRLRARAPRDPSRLAG